MGEEPPAGLAPPDAGLEPPDAGAAPPDAGLEPLDAGADPPDAGPDPPDAGVDPADAGPPASGTVLPEQPTARTPTPENTVKNKNARFIEKAPAFRFFRFVKRATSLRQLTLKIR